jgi:hypothetical protein
MSTNRNRSPQYKFRKNPFICTRVVKYGQTDRDKHSGGTMPIFQLLVTNAPKPDYSLRV